MTRPRRGWQRSWGASLLVALLLAGCGSPVRNPVTGQQERSVLSEDAEVALGRKEHQQVLQEYAPYDHPRLQAYVSAVGQRLAAQSHRSQLQWHFTVLDSPEVNAFALPGGYVYITRGILAFMESEADLAGVLGHEIGHVTARHGAQRATRQQDASLGVLAAAVLGAVLDSRGAGGVGRAVTDVSQAAAAGYIASYGREQELQADSLGAEYLSRVRFNPANMIDVIRVLKNQEEFAADQARAQGRAPPARNSWLASHPSNDQRLAAISQLAQQYRGSWGDDGRAAFLQAIEGMRFGDSEQQGLVRGRQFYHPLLGVAITAPAQWSIQNGRDRLVLVNGARDAALTLLTVPASAGASPEEVIRNGFRPQSGRVERGTLNGMPATHFSGLRSNAGGQLEPLLLSIVQGPQGRRYALVWNGRDAPALQRAQASLLEARNSFRPLSVADQAEARPWVLRLVPYPAGGFAELARHSPLPAAQQQLRLLNGHYGGGEPRAGQLTKIVDRR